MELENNYLEYAIPAGIALFLKTLFLFKVSIRSSLDQAFAILCIAMIVQNACEFVGYIVLAHNLELAKFIVNGYMLASYVITSAGLYFSLVLADIDTRKYNIVLCAMPIAMIVMHLAGLMVSDYAYNGYTLIRVAASMYFLFEFWAVFCAIASVIVLARKFNKTKDPFIATRCKVGMIAIAPFCIVVVTVMTLMHFNINVSTAIVMPISGVFFLLVLMKATEKEIFDITYTFVLAKVFIGSNPMRLFKKGIPLHERIALFEEIWIKVAQEESQGSQRVAAQILGIHESTLSRKISKMQEKNQDEVPS